MYTPVGKMTMRKVALLSGFLWNQHGFLTSKFQGLYDHTPNSNDSTKENKKNCVWQSPKCKTKSNDITSTVALPPVNSITNTSQASPPSLNERKMTVNKIESNDGHGNTDSMPPNDKCQDMIPHSMPKLDNGHIHQASPICDLPPESSFNNITTASQQQISNEITPPQTTAHSHSKLNPLTNPTLSDKAQNERTGFSHGKLATQSRYCCQGQLLGKQKASIIESKKELDYTKQSVATLSLVILCTKTKTEKGLTKWRGW